MLKILRRSDRARLIEWRGSDLLHERPVVVGRARADVDLAWPQRRLGDAVVGPLLDDVVHGHHLAPLVLLATWLRTGRRARGRLQTRRGADVGARRHRGCGRRPPRGAVVARAAHVLLRVRAAGRRGCTWTAD
eukprot:1499903-Prymnesium_polylepis.1